MRNNIYIEAMEKWGKELQMVVCMEECAELIKEISKKIRYPDTKNNSQLLNEIVDVSICIDSLMSIFKIPSKDFSKTKELKLDRLKKRVRCEG